MDMAGVSSALEDQSLQESDTCPLCSPNPRSAHPTLWQAVYTT